MTRPTHACSEPLLELTDALCRIPSWWRPEDRPGKVPRHNEMALAERVAAELSKCPWLDVSIVEAAPGRPNVLAFDGNPAETEILVAGHLDTVPPSDCLLYTSPSPRD